MDELQEVRNEVKQKTVRFMDGDLTEAEWWQFTVLARQRRRRVGYILGLYIRSFNKMLGGGNANSDKGPGEGL